MKHWNVVLMIAALAALTACSAEPDGNVFEGQTEAIKKAEDANRMLEEAAQAQRRAIEEQSR